MRSTSAKMNQIKVWNIEAYMWHADMLNQPAGSRKKQYFY